MIVFISACHSNTETTDMEAGAEVEDSRAQLFDEL